MSKRKLLGTYVNGNTIVVLYNDGTKIRYVREGEVYVPRFPESIDLKITNMCNLGCPMCAEQSSPSGKHSDLFGNILLDSLHPYTELAIGGGNPMEHPDLIPFLHWMRDKKVVCNLTVNVDHFIQNRDLLLDLTKRNLIHGIGISVIDDVPFQFFDAVINFPNAVIHTIAGYTPIGTYKMLQHYDLNLLILGYKLKGRGEKYYYDDRTNVSDKIHWLTDNIQSMRGCFKAIAFDNLAVKQLKLSEFLTTEEMDKYYMGDDGEFTMYIDLVTNRFAKSSTDETCEINDTNIDVLFNQVQRGVYKWN